MLGYQIYDKKDKMKKVYDKMKNIQLPKICWKHIEIRRKKLWTFLKFSKTCELLFLFLEASDKPKW